MQKYINNKVAKRLLITGGALIIITGILGIIFLFAFYNTISADDINTANKPGVADKLMLFSALTKVTRWLQIAGFVIVGLGTIIFIIASSKQPKK